MLILSFCYLCKTNCHLWTLWWIFLLRFSSSLIRAFGLSFMDSLVLLNVQQQEKAFLGCALSSNHRYKVDTLEWFRRSQPTGGGRQLGLSHPVRTETVNTAMPPALLSGTNTGRGCVVRGLTSLYPPVSPRRAKKLSLVSRSSAMCIRFSEFNYCSLLATPVISLFQSYALGASQCHTLSPKWFLLWPASESTNYMQL